MTDALVLGGKLLSLLDESARTTTYKPALLLALIDRVQEYVDEETIAVRALAERVVELYWPQTLPYPTTGTVLSQSQTHGRATIPAAIQALRDGHGTTSRSLPQAVRLDDSWERTLDLVEESLAQWPIPRLQRPFGPFLYDFTWRWEESGGWSVRAYRNGDRALALRAGVAPALTSLGPLLRPFITRWWTDKAAQLNPNVEAARSVLDFENFLFGTDRVALDRVAEGLLDLQSGRCFYCTKSITRHREIDHFVPWSYSGDDGLDNLVAACRACNNSKRATLAGPQELSRLLERNADWTSDLASLATERRWPRDAVRSSRVARSAYMLSPDERPVWTRRGAGFVFGTIGEHRLTFSDLFGARHPEARGELSRRGPRSGETVMPGSRPGPGGAREDAERAKPA